MNSYVVHTILMASVLRMNTTTVTDPNYLFARALTENGMAIAQFGAYMFCLLALELLPLVIDVFQQRSKLQKIKWLKWLTSFFFYWL
jgi:hypothetical protein